MAGCAKLTCHAATAYIGDEGLLNNKLSRTMHPRARIEDEKTHFSSLTYTIITEYIEFVKYRTAHTTPHCTERVNHIQISHIPPHSLSHSQPSPTTLQKSTKSQERVYERGKRIHKNHGPPTTPTILPPHLSTPPHPPRARSPRRVRAPGREHEDGTSCPVLFCFSALQKWFTKSKSS